MRADPRALTWVGRTCAVPFAAFALASMGACGAEVPPPVATPPNDPSPAAPSTPATSAPATSAPLAVAGDTGGRAGEGTVAPAAAGAVATRSTASSAKGPFPESTDPALREPAKATAKAPATFSIRFVTTVGDFDVACTRRWAPHGADRLFNLVKLGFFDDVAFFRVVKQPRPFVVQFGIHGNPEVSRLWRDASLPVDKPVGSNVRGTLTYAMAGRPDTRTTQLFINLYDNVVLDKMGFAPVCKVTGDGMDTVERIEGEYGEEPSNLQGEIQTAGNALLRGRFPKLDYIETARLVDAGPPRK